MGKILSKSNATQSKIKNSKYISFSMSDLQELHEDMKVMKKEQERHENVLQDIKYVLVHMHSKHKKFKLVNRLYKLYVADIIATTRWQEIICLKYDILQRFVDLLYQNNDEYVFRGRSRLFKCYHHFAPNQLCELMAIKNYILIWTHNDQIWYLIKHVSADESSMTLSNHAKFMGLEYESGRQIYVFENARLELIETHWMDFDTLHYFKCTDDINMDKPNLYGGFIVIEFD